MPEISEEELASLKAAAEAKTALENSKSRLEEENAKIKARAKEAEEKINAAEKAKLEESGKLEELLAKEREEKKKLHDDLLNTKATVISEKLRAEVAKKAKDCQDIDLLLSLPSSKEHLKVNDDLTIEGVDDFLAKAKESHAFMFTKKKMPDTDDGGSKGGKTDTKDPKEEYIAALRACKSQREMNEVMRKFGKDLHT